MRMQITQYKHLQQQARIQDFGQGVAESWPQGGPWAQNLLEIGVFAL